MKNKIFVIKVSGNKVYTVYGEREKDSGEWKALCPVCGEEEKLLSINEEANIIRCHGRCQRLGMIVTQEPKEQASPPLQPDKKSKPRPQGTTGNHIFKDNWKNYYSIGLFPIPARRDKKAPCKGINLKDEKEQWIDYDPDDLKLWEEKFSDANILVRLGDSIVVFDPDGLLAEKFVQELNLPKCPTSRSGGKSKHRYFSTPEPLDPLIIRFGEGDHLEIRTGRQMMMAPPSVHPETGRAYRWEDQSSPWDMGGCPVLPIEIYRKLESMALPKMTGPFKDSDESKFGKIDLQRYLNDYGVPIAKVKQRGNTTMFLLKNCLWSASHGHGDLIGDSAFFQDEGGRLGYSCFHNACEGRGWKEARYEVSQDKPLYMYGDKYDPNFKSKEEPPPSDEQQQEQPAGEEFKGKKTGRNVTEEVRILLEDYYGPFTIQQIYQDLSVTSPAEKDRIRVELHKQCKEGAIERGRVAGSYIKIDKEMTQISILDEKPAPLNITLPGKVEELVEVYPGNIIVVAGSPNEGKTAYCLNVAYDNRDILEVYYFSSEMGSDELTLRVSKFDDRHLKKEWRDKVKFIKRTQDFHQVIKPNALNIIDYLEAIEAEYFKIGDNIRKIYEKLDKGIAVIALQMDKGASFAWGGQKTLDKPRIYLTLDNHELKIKKGKLRASSMNPYNKVKGFSLIGGSTFKWDDEWKDGKKDKGEGKGEDE